MFVYFTPAFVGVASRNTPTAHHVDSQVWCHDSKVHCPGPEQDTSVFYSTGHWKYGASPEETKFEMHGIQSWSLNNFPNNQTCKTVHWKFCFHWYLTKTKLSLIRNKLITHHNFKHTPLSSFGENRIYHNSCIYRTKPIVVLQHMSTSLSYVSCFMNFDYKNLIFLISHTKGKHYLCIHIITYIMIFL
jgi:hypothetical protein